MKKKFLVVLLALFSCFILAVTVSCSCSPFASDDSTGSSTTYDDGGSGDDIIKVTRIIVNTEDEINDGTIEKPLAIFVAQGKQIEIVYNVQPRDAADKTFTWLVGEISEGAFAVADKGVTVSDSGTKLTIEASLTAESCAIEGLANDGSGVVVYLYVGVTEYVGVSAVSSSVLTRAEEGQEYDYAITMALGTNWDMSAGITKRGRDLLDGKVFSGLQAPRNITYYPNVYNVGIVVSPLDATDKDVTVSYSNEGIALLDTAGNLSTQGAGETIVTVASYADPAVNMKIKVTVVDSLYRGITREAYQNAPMATNPSWDLDTDHASGAQMSRYDDWHLVMIHSNLKPGDTGIDNNQKIFYMGESTRPYGICLENNVGARSGASLLDSLSLMWAKITVPEGAVTFNVKMGNNDKVHGQYRVVFVKPDGTVYDLSDGWHGFTVPSSEAIYKFALPDEIKGLTGAMVIEHRLTEFNNNAELQVKVMNFEGQVDVTGVVFATDSAIYRQGERQFGITATVLPANATNDKVTYAMAIESEGKGVTVDGNGNVTVSAEAVGEYRIIASSVADPTKTAVFTLTITAEEIEVNEWTGKNEILNGVSDVKWEFINEGHDMGVGEGADLSIRHGVTYAAIQLTDRRVKSSSFILTFGARVFRRAGEIYPKFLVYVIEDGAEPALIRGIGQENDYFYVDTDETQYCGYDLSAYIGKTVNLQIGIREGTHAVVQHIVFTGNAENYTVWRGKAAILDPNTDPWTINGSADMGVGEGVDIKYTGSYISNSFVIGEHYNALFTFGARVFVRGGETYPYVNLVVVDKGGVEHIIRAMGAESDAVYIESDTVLKFSYNLTPFAGQEVEIRIRLANNATHCAIAIIEMAAYTGDIAVEDIAFEKTEETFLVGEREFNVRAYVTPSNATNNKVAYAMAAESAGKGVTVDATGKVTVSAAAEAGEYVIIATALGDESKTASFTLTLTAIVREVNEWTGKNEILNGVLDVKWEFINEGCDLGVGEGADLSIRHGVTYAALQLTDREIRNSSYVLTFGARVFRRAGEIYPKFLVYVIEENEEPVLIRGAGQQYDYFYVDTDATQYCSYDLSAFIGKTVNVQIGIKEGTHAVVQHIKFEGTPVTVWANKGEILNNETSNWAINGNTDAGVGEGADIINTGSYLYNTVVIGRDHNALFTFGGRVFHREGETYPEVKLIVVDEDGVEHLVRASGAESDAVYFDTDAIQYFTYDLSAFAGQKVELRILLANNATHCVITNISMSAAV